MRVVVKDDQQIQAVLHVMDALADDIGKAACTLFAFAKAGWEDIFRESFFLVGTLTQAEDMEIRTRRA